MPEFVIYTDGASRKDGRGGWGYTIRWQGAWWDECGGAFQTTNNRMELQAAISALQCIDSLVDPGERACVQLWADSQYVLLGVTDHAEGWIFRNWRTSTNRPVKNKDLWLELLQVAGRHDVDWQWVRGHTGNEGNERADRLAAEGVPTAKQKETDAPSGCVPVLRRAVRRTSSRRTSET
jgi:ribonuclease HI